MNAKNSRAFQIFSSRLSSKQNLDPESAAYDVERKRTLAVMLLYCATFIQTRVSVMSHFNRKFKRVS